MPLVLGQFLEASHQELALFEMLQIGMPPIEFTRCRLVRPDPFDIVLQMALKVVYGPPHLSQAALSPELAIAVAFKRAAGTDPANSVVRQPNAVGHDDVRRVGVRYVRAPVDAIVAEFFKRLQHPIKGRVDED